MLVFLDHALRCCNFLDQSLVLLDYLRNDDVVIHRILDPCFTK
jgi:hypothetical protein